MKVKEDLEFSYLNTEFFRRVGCRIKFNRTVETPVVHHVSGKVLYYKADHRSLTITLFKGGMVVDHWISDKLYTYHCSDFHSLNKSTIIGKIRYMSSFYAKFVETMLFSIKKKDEQQLKTV
jgi:hypothetical protein